MRVVSSPKCPEKCAICAGARTGRVNNGQEFTLDGHKVMRLDQAFKVAQAYGDRPREMGPFDPKRFAGVYDIAADLEGGFFKVEVIDETRVED